MRQFNTLTGFLSSKSSSLTAGDTVEFQGYTSIGDGGAATWQHNGTTGQTPSQSPAQLGDALLNDGNGNQWSADRGKPLSLAALGGLSAVDATDAIFAWLKASGDLYANDGVYTIAEAGANAGGVDVTINQSMTVNCAPNAFFVAGNNLDNDMIRISANPALTDKIKVIWRGGNSDQILQKNSTSIPNSAEYPPVNLGTSSTAGFLTINGEVDDGGTPVNMFSLTSVTGVKGVASATGHWQSAGGDSCISVNGVKVITNNNDITGSRDAAIYPSGLSSGTTEGVSGDSSDNVFRGCFAGTTAKRFFNKISQNRNVGINTASIAVFSIVTGPSVQIEATGNKGENAWLVVRSRESDVGTISNNTSVNHGHKLEDGNYATTVFNASNACVRVSGSTNIDVYENRCQSKAAGFADEVSTVLLDNNTGGTTSESCTISSNHSGNIDFVVQETGGSNNNTMWKNLGSATSSLVSLIGANSLDLDAVNIYNRGEDVVISSGTITITNSYHRVGSEGGSASDDLVTISNGKVEGQRLVLKALSSSETIVIKHGVGNILLNDLTDKSLNQTHDLIELMWVEQFGFWCQVSFSNNGA